MLKVYCDPNARGPHRASRHFADVRVWKFVWHRGEATPSCSFPAWSQWQQHQQRRCISEEQINADGATVAELFEQSLSKASRKRPPGEEGGGPPRLLTTRREALHLYREIMRYSNLFVWKDDKGNVWRDILRANARKEYDSAREEIDPEIINKLIITGRDAVQRTVESFWKKRNSIIREEAALREGGIPPPPPPPNGGFRNE